MFDKLLGKNKVSVLRGTIPSGDYTFEHGVLYDELGVPVVDFHNDLDKIHRENTETEKDLRIALGATLGLSLLFGPLGLIGLLLGNKNMVLFKVNIAPSEEDKDGEEFLAYCDSKVYRKIVSYSVEY